MRITDRNLTGASAAETGRSQETQAAERENSARENNSGGGSTTDHVEFSGTLARVSQALAASNASRSTRVNALAAQYQSGTYRADSLATSRGIVSEALNASGEAA